MPLSFEFNYMSSCMSYRKRICLAFKIKVKLKEPATRGTYATPLDLSMWPNPHHVYINLLNHATLLLNNLPLLYGRRLIYVDNVPICSLFFTSSSRPKYIYFVTLLIFDLYSQMACWNMILNNSMQYNRTRNVNVYELISS